MSGTPGAAAAPKAGRYDNLGPDEVRRLLENAGMEVDMSGVQAGARGPTSDRDQATMDGLHANYQQAMIANKAANDFAIRNSVTPTGAILGSKMGQDMAQRLNWGHPENYGMMSQDNIQLAAANKPAAIRQLTQRELGWLKATAPDLSLSGNQNAEFQKTYNNRYIYSKAKKAFYQSYLDKKGSLDGAEDAWDSFDEAHFDPQGNYIRPQAPAAATVKPSRDQVNSGLNAMSAAAKAKQTGWQSLGPGG